MLTVIYPGVEVIMRRRLFLGMVGSFLVLADAWGQSVARIAILTDFVDAPGAAGDAISKLTNGFKSLVVTGVDSYNYVAVKRERTRLIDISRNMTNLIVSQNINIIQSLDLYLTIPEPTNSDWV